MRLRIPAAMAALVALTALAQAQTATVPSSPSSPNRTTTNNNAAPASRTSQVSAADRNFATKAASAGLAEVNAAQIALKNSDRQDVKAFAQRMVQDHTKANDQLKSIASSKGIDLPSEPSAADQKKSEELQKLRGARFDRQYIENQRTAHKEAVTLFETQSKNGKDAQLKSFASETLPTLQDHLKMISAMPLTQNQSPQTSSKPQ